MKTYTYTEARQRHTCSTRLAVRGAFRFAVAMDRYSFFNQQAPRAPR